MKLNISEILFWIFFVLAIIFFFWFVFGDSPTFEQTLLIFILGFVVTNYANIRSLRVNHNNLKRSFITLAQGFKEHTKHE